MLTPLDAPTLYEIDNNEFKKLNWILFDNKETLIT